MEGLRKIIKKYRSSQGFQISNYEMRNRSVGRTNELGDFEGVSKSRKRNDGMALKTEKSLEFIKDDLNELQFTFSDEM